MARTPRDPRPDARDREPGDEPSASSGRWIIWTVYAILALGGFCFGAWAGNQRPARTNEVAAVTSPAKEPTGKDTPPRESTVKDAPAPVEKGEPKSVSKPAPEPAPKKDVTPPQKAPETKTPDATTPEPTPPSAPTPTPPTPEPKKPVAKPPEPKKPDPKPAGKEVSFAKEVMPIFRSKCLNCHGASKGPKGDLDLKTVASILKGGDNGPGVKPGDLKAGTVWKSIEDGSMPPDGKPPLTSDEKKVVENWILGGAKP